MQIVIFIISGFSFLYVLIALWIIEKAFEQKKMDTPEIRKKVYCRALLFPYFLSRVVLGRNRGATEFLQMFWDELSKTVSDLTFEFFIMGVGVVMVTMMVSGYQLVFESIMLMSLAIILGYKFGKRFSAKYPKITGAAMLAFYVCSVFISAVIYFK